MQELVPYRKLAIGYNTREPDIFEECLKPWLPAVLEVYFSWPGEPSGRDMNLNCNYDLAEERLLETLRRLRRDGVKLDLLFNANCYGPAAFDPEMHKTVDRVMAKLAQHQLLPEVVTTTSQYIARVIKLDHPAIKVRASVNMHLRTTMSMEFIADLFDSFYISRELNRDLATVQIFSEWCRKNGKEFCMLANSACLRSCPVQTFHDNLIAHNSVNGRTGEYELQMPFRLCQRRLKDPENRIDIIRNSTWVRPEDMHYYEPLVDVIKLATRTVATPDLILRAYATGHYDGNLLNLLGLPAHTYIDNKAFPPDWIEQGIAQTCAPNCTKCGKCEALLAATERQDLMPPRYNFATAPIRI